MAIESSRPKSRFRTSARWVLLTALCLVGTLAAQEERKRKVPAVLDKLTSGASEQAFTGTVESLDLHRAVLNVNAVQGGDTEIFPIKKSIRVATADGSKLKLASLTPGTKVLVYFEQKADRRTVKDIVVLATDAPKKEPEKKSPPPS